MVNDGYNVPFAFLSDCAKYLQGETRIQKFWKLKILVPKIQNNKTPYLLDFQRKKIRQVFFILVLFRFLRSTLVCGELANRYDDWLYSIY